MILYHLESSAKIAILESCWMHVGKKNRLTLMYKLSHNLVDINTEEHLIPNSKLRQHNSHAFKYRLPKVSKDVFKFSFFPRSITCLLYTSDAADE